MASMTKARVLTCELVRSIDGKSIADLGFEVDSAPVLRLLDGQFTGLSEFKCTGKVWTDLETGEKLTEFKTFKGLAIILRSNARP